MTPSPYITIEDVRHYMMDRTPDDNGVDLEYSNDEIRQAMIRAARDYNSLPPRVSDADPDRLSARTNMFLDAIAAQLYTATLAKLTRNDIDYTAGGVSTNINAKRIMHLRELIQTHRNLFREAAQQEKIAINLDDAYGHF